LFLLSSRRFLSFVHRSSSPNGLAIPSFRFSSFLLCYPTVGFFFHVQQFAKLFLLSSQWTCYPFLRFFPNLSSLISISSFPPAGFSLVQQFAKLFLLSSRRFLSFVHRSSSPNGLAIPSFRFSSFLLCYPTVGFFFHVQQFAKLFLLSSQWTCYPFLRFFPNLSSLISISSFPPAGFFFPPKLFLRRLLRFGELLSTSFLLTLPLVFSLFVFRASSSVFGKGRDALATCFSVGYHFNILHLTFYLRNLREHFPLYPPCFSPAGASEYLCLLGWRVGIDLSGITTTTKEKTV